MMTLRQQLLTVADSFVAHTGRARSTLSNRIFTDGGRLDGIAAGKDLKTRSFERAMEWFSTNWPRDLDWPDGIDRPAAEPTRPLRADDRLEA